MFRSNLDSTSKSFNQVLSPHLAARQNSTNLVVPSSSSPQQLPQVVYVAVDGEEPPLPAHI